MRLIITTPTAVVVDEPAIRSLRAEDETGSFGILQGHEDFLTALSICVVSWESGDQDHAFCAVRRGVLTVSDGDKVAIATREAVVSRDLDHLAHTVLARMRQRAEDERASRNETLELQMRAIRHIVRYLHPEHAGLKEGGA
jgi:F-type H+-transporting ATPase subunit epsilon